MSKVPLSEEVRKDIAWWLDDRDLTIGVPLHSPPQGILLFSDASHEGWGAHLEDLLTAEVWDHQDKQLHINILELKAAFLAIQEF